MTKHSEKIDTVFNLALQVQSVSLKRSRIAAALYKRNKLVSVGFCHNKIHPFQAKYSKTKTHTYNTCFDINKDAIFFHAETHAIYTAVKMYGEEFVKTSGLTLYVARAKKDRNIRGNCKPCAGCYRAIKDFNIKNVYYTEDENVYGDQVIGHMFCE